MDWIIAHKEALGVGLAWILSEYVAANPDSKWNGVLRAILQFLPGGKK